MPSSQTITISRPSRKPEVSVVLCAYNEEHYLDACLHSLKQQRFKNFEVVLVDDGSTDNTLRIAERYDLRVVRQDHKGLGAARNNGVKHSTGNIIVFLDADMTFHEDYLTYLIKPIQEGTTHGTTHGTEHAQNLSNIWARCWGKIRVDPRIKARVPHNYRAILKSVFEKAGGFDPSWGYADDRSLTAKIGYATLVYDAICYHNNPSNLKETYLQARWIGGSYSLKILYALLVGLLIFFAILFVSSKVYGFLPSLLTLLIILLGFYILFTFFMTLRTVKREHNLSIFCFYPVFLTVRVIASLHGLLRKLTGKHALQ